LCQGSVAIVNGAVVSKAGSANGPRQRPAPGTFGDAGYNSLRGPRYFETDIAILKNISLTERYRMQFRMDVANLFNKPNYDLPSACVDCQGAGIRT
jgi:hypothetical protein